MRGADIEQNIYEYLGTNKKFIRGLDIAKSSDKADEKIKKYVDKTKAELEEKVIKLIESRNSHMGKIARAQTESEKNESRYELAKIDKEIKNLKDEIKQLEEIYEMVKDYEHRKDLSKRIISYKYERKPTKGLASVSKDVEMESVSGENQSRKYGNKFIVTKLGQIPYVEKSIESTLVPDIDAFFYAYKVENLEEKPRKPIVIYTREELINPTDKSIKEIGDNLLCSEVLEASQLPGNRGYIGSILPNGELSIAQKEKMTLTEKAVHEAVYTYGEICEKRISEQMSSKELEDRYYHVADYSIIDTVRDSDGALRLKNFKTMKDKIKMQREYGEEKSITRLGIATYGDADAFYAYDLSYIKNGIRKTFRIYTIEDLIKCEDEQAKLIKDVLLSEEVVLASQLPCNKGYIGTVTEDGVASLRDERLFGSEEEQRCLAAVSLYTEMEKRDREQQEVLDMVNNKNRKNNDSKDGSSQEEQR